MISKDIRNLKDRYQNGSDRYGAGRRDNIGRDLMVPCLREAKLYRRGTGFFSSSALKSYVEVLDRMINEDIKIEILCSPVVKDRALLRTLEHSKNEEERRKTLRNLSDQVLLIAAGYKANQDRPDYAAKLLSYLIASDKLEVRFAVPKKFDEINHLESEEDLENQRNLYHVKLGYFKFPEGEIVAFDGSFNESDSGLRHHSDRTTVFKSWEVEDAKRVRGIVEDIDSDWNGSNDSIIVYELSSEAIDIIKGMSDGNRPDRSKYAKAPSEESSTEKPNLLEPHIPMLLYGEKFSLKPHQEQALKSWQSNGFKGIFALATGAGKTITAIYALVKLWQRRKRVVFVVAVPYIVLAEQWCDVLNLFGIFPVRAYNNQNIWKQSLEEKIGSYLLGGISLLPIVVVNKTLRSDQFLEIIKKVPIDDLMFVGDECHHHSTSNFSPLIPQGKFMMGLSATPWRKGDVEAQGALEGVYGEIVATYSIDQALEDNVLTPYDYILHQIDMSESEFQEHEDLSFKIAQMTAARENGQSINEDALKALIRKRIRLVGSCENKFEQLRLWVSNLPSSQKHTLFYVGDGSTESSIADGDLLRDIEKVTVILSQNNWRVSKVTADETADERHRIIKRFASGEINAIAAIKVLDEGFDLPACKEAHLLASSRNERQYIQRRGRILRKMRGKELAYIHDYVVIPSRKTAASKRLVQEELLRVTEFSRVASNREELQVTIDKLISEWS